MKRVLVLGMSFALAVTVVACSSSGTTEEANEQYCAALDELSSEVSVLTDLVAGNATVEDLQEQRREIQQAAVAVGEAAEGVDEAVSDEVAQAEQAFTQAIDDISSDATVEEAAQAYAEAAQAFNNTLREELSQLGCS